MSNAVEVQAILSSALVSLTIDTLFFGLFSGTCAASLWLLINKSAPHRPIVGRMGPAVLLSFMFVFALTYLVLDINIILHGFVYNAGNPTAIVQVVTPESRSDWGTTMTILYIQICLADAFMVYRLFTVWDRNHWAAITPALFWLGAVAVGATMIANIFHFEDDLTGGIRTVLFFTFSFITNGLCATLIMGRLIRNYSRNLTAKPRLPDSPWIPRTMVIIADIIIESAVVYFAASVGLLAYMIVGLPHASPKWIIGGMPSFIGISMSAIVLWELQVRDTEPESDTEIQKLRAQTA
ncbi:hypothetical protein L226DRAFT_537006 [Lentinus tigrinus ALCF2SS1-7]|uniref:Uncharacterized protein n=1 Tax=Lentinus tigrinus ALCF2SS1-6 TaxID=1328759 RepID=A0A5C2S4P0_9APHY|nr:hypothetical protein L227DRAFT_612642 [Lentinus tigrinus ALCF2SS1-6]RPD72839.1 hypothetical protein L226DRAFT_537006 [Lentinus tigrinus ALCF2SS1-7]